MKNIIVKLSTECDTPKIIDLLKRNRFYIGKYKSDLTEEYYDDIQEKRGMIFSVIAEKSNEIIGFLAVYKSGCQRIAKENEVFISSFLIDKKYRNSYYTLYDMFLFAVEEIIKRGYTIISSEVSYDNYLSLHILRKVGFVLLDNIPDIYNNLVLHNYVCGLTKMLEINSQTKKSTLMKLLPYIKKKDLLRTNEKIEKEYVLQTYDLPCGLSNILFHVNSGSPVGVEIREKFKIFPQGKSLCRYTLYNLSNKPEKVYIFFNNYELLQTLASHTCKEIEIPANCKNFKILLKDINYSFNLDVIKPSDFRNQSFIKQLSDCFEVNCNTGVLNIVDKNIKFREIWPSLTSPYLTAGIIPNEFAKQDYYQINNKFVLLEKNDFIIVKREYIYEENRVSISTSYKSLTFLKIDPFYQIVLDDLHYLCEFQFEGKLLDYAKYNPNDRSSYTEEIMFEDFKCNNSKINDINVIVKYDNTKYRIEFPKNTKIFMNCNCIIARQSLNDNFITNKDNYISLGEIIIIKYKEEVKDDST